MHAITIVSVVEIQVTIVVHVKRVIGAMFYKKYYPIYLSNILSTFILSYLKQFL